MVSNNDQSSNETSTEELGEHYASEGEVSQDEVSVLGDDRFKSKLDTQETLLHATKKLLSHFGMVFSLGAVRDLPEKVGKIFDPLAAVSALTHVGFNASYGEFPLKRLTIKHFPSIGFTSNGEAILINGIDDDGKYTISRFDENDIIIEEKYDFLGLKRKVKPYFIIAQKKNNKLRKDQKNNWFWGSMSQGKWLYAQVIGAAAMTNFLGLSTSLFIMVVYDRVVPNEAIESLIALTIGVLIALFFDFIIKTLRAQFVDRAGRRADLRMSRLIFDKILNMRIDAKNRKSGALASIVREFDTLREFFTSATLIAVVDLPFIFFFIWVISLIAGPLALVPLIAVPCVILSGLVIQPFLARLAEGSMETNMSKQSILVETLNGIETVQATGSGRLMRKRFEEAADAQSEFGLKNRVLTQFAVNSAASIQQLAQIATIFFGVFLIQDGIISMGAMIAAVILGGRTLSPLSQLASAMSRANSARQAYRSLSEIMNEKKGNISDQIRARLSRPHFDGNIELKNLTYTFPGSTSPIINNLSLKIPAGQKVAIVGRMGSGKSTLSRLISGLIEPTEGAVMMDGVDLRQIDKSDVRRNIGVMLQDTWLFSGTVKENLQMGYYEYDDAHILNIARISGVDSFIANRPQGYDMELKEHGEGLSGGQRQSINLARSLLHQPNLLILDEPTSSMDTATEKSVIEGLKSWSNLRSMVIVTHRNTLLDIVDRVLVVDEGKILADTTPEQLKAQGQG